MELDLRRKAVGGYWRGGLGQSGETAVEGSGLPTDPGPDFNAVTYESGEVDLSTLAAPGYNITTAPIDPYTGSELQAEQGRARSWLETTFPSALNTTTKLLMSAGQISAGVAAGAVKKSATCPSGYMVSGTGACVVPQTGPAAQAQLIPGLDNRSLAIIGGGLLFLFLLAGRKGR
jgi:hypothetical protein